MTRAVRATATVHALQVSGGTGTRCIPPFDPDTHHYALTCSNSTTLEVSAKAAPSGAVLTLLRANSDDNHASTGALEDAPVRGESER